MIKVRMHPELEDEVKFPQRMRGKTISNGTRRLAGKIVGVKQRGNGWDYITIETHGSGIHSLIKEWTLPAYESVDELDVALSSGELKPSEYLELLKNLN